MAQPARVRIENGTVVASGGELLRGVPVWVFRFGKETGRTAHFDDPAFYHRLRNLGCNAIRIVCLDAWQQANGYIHWDVLDRAEMAQLAQEIQVLVDLAGAQGLYVLIDYHTSGGCNEQRLLAFWDVIAPRFANQPHVFYELANEPVAWFPNDYCQTDIELQERIFRRVRALAPETHLVLFSFANTVGEPEDSSIVDVVGMADIDWENASVGFHPYKTGHSSAAIRELRERFPVLNTEMNVVCPPDNPHHAQPMDGQEWGFETMEALGISWFAWDTETPEKFEQNFVKGVIADAKAKQYSWESRSRVEKPQTPFQNFRATFPFAKCAEVMGFSWGRVAATTGLNFLAALMDAAMLAAMLPFARAMMQGNFQFLEGMPIAGRITQIESAPQQFLVVALLILLLGLLKNACVFGANAMVAHSYTEYAAKLSNWALGRFLQFGKGYYDRNGSSRIGALIDHNHDVLGLWQSALRMLATGLMLTAYLSVMLLVSPQLTLAILLIAPVLHYSFVWAKMRSGEAAAQSAQWNRVAGKLASDIYRALPLYRSFGREGDGLKAFEAVVSKRNQATQAVWIPQELVRRFQDCAILLALLSLLAVAMLASPGNALNVPKLLVFFYVARITLPQVTQLHDAALSFLQHIPGALEFAGLFTDENKWIVPSGNLEVPATVGRIEVVNLTFAYPDGRTGLRGVSLDARRGDLTALSGVSGAGKSTLIHLLSRFYDASPGTILLDGVDIREFRLESLRRSISLVSQETLLLSGSIRDNLVFGMEQTATDQELWLALRGVGLDGFVRSKPGGLDAAIGDGAGELSGGQRQRISIARAILKQAPILLLDEPSSAVDGIAEEQILATLMATLPKSIAIVATHRLATMERAHQVYVFDEGRVVEHGTPSELMGSGGMYQRMFATAKAS